MSALLSVSCSETRPPNLVVLLADDLGWNDVGWHGSELRTPALDELADQGVRLESFYTPPRCSPSRAALLTGRHPFRYGLQADVVRPWARYGLPLEERTLATALSDAGYQTHLVGKWHLGSHAPALLPTRRGFDHHYGGYLGQIDHFRHESLGGLDWHRDERPLTEAGHTTDLLATEAVRVIESRDPEQPLFMLVAFYAPHAPLQAPREWAERQGDARDPKRRVFGAMVEMLDDAVGRIVRALDREGIAGETVVFFASDNGGGTRFGADNGPLSGGKGRLLEGGVRVPAFVTWPGRLEGGREMSAPTHMVDIFPTLVELAGVSRARDELDGVDFWPWLSGSADVPGERELVIHAEPGAAALRRGPWKLREETRDGGVVRTLHDVVSDPREARDLASQQPRLADELAAALSRATSSSVPPLGGARRPPQGFVAPPTWGPATR